MVKNKKKYKSDSISIPIWLLKELKLGWTYELSYDDEIKTAILCPFQYFSKKEREKAEKLYGKLKKT